MPITPTYPGVYVEELSSGVRTIAGVSTSVAVFIGSAKRGPIDRAVPVRSWADFERRYGGLSLESELSYTVQQFFNNGGTEAIVIRVAAGVVRANKTLKNAADAGVLEITAADSGSGGNAIEIRVAHSPNPNTFSLTALLIDPSNPIVETFDNLSLNSRSPRFVEAVINSQSELIRAKRVANLGFGGASSISGAIDTTKINGTHNQFRLALNGGEPITIELEDPTNNRTALVARIKAQALAKGTGPAYGAGFDVTEEGSDQIKITAAQTGDFTSVRILPGLVNDAAGVLHLGADNGGTEIDGVTPFRPVVAPTRPSITSTPAFVNGDIGATFPPAGKQKFKITMNGLQHSIDIGAGDILGGAAQLADKLKKIALHIEQRVRDAAPGSTAFTGFTARVDAAGTGLVFTSGDEGAGKTIRVNTGDPAANDVLALLKFADNQNGSGTTTRLEQGADQPYTEANLETVFTGKRADRTGLYALEEIDIFNLLCLPGISNTSLLATAAAYCEERRAFLLADPPPSKKPDQMSSSAQSYPKSKNGAVYYPRVGVSDPLQGGVIRLISPSGSVAGVIARTDATRGVWKAPAGSEANMVGVQKLEYVLTDAENGVLNPIAVNCLRLFPTYGTVAWGARTLVGSNSGNAEWRYIPIRRLALFIEESLYRGTKWAVFEPNDEPLWAQLRMNIGSFMHDLFRQGAFQGSSPRDAYLVKCDKDTTTQSDVNRGVVNVVVGFAPLKPAEFVFLKIQQLAGQLNA